MDNKKIVTVAVLAVLALAFAGYGYADYTASTYNAGNNVVVNYIEVEPGQWDAIAAAENIKLDTYTYNGDYDVLYVLPANMTLDNDGYVQLGEDYTLTIRDGTTETFDAYNIEVTVQGVIAAADNFKLYLDYGATDGPIALASTMTLEGVSSDVTLKLLMQVTDIDTKNFPTAEGWDTITGSTVGPGVEEPLLAGLEGVDDPEDADRTGAIFIFKVTPVTN